MLMHEFLSRLAVAPDSQKSRPLIASLISLCLWCRRPLSKPLPCSEIVTAWKCDCLKIAPDRSRRHTRPCRPPSENLR